MAWPATLAQKAGKGIASLFKPKGKPDLVTSSVRNAQSAKLFAQMNKKNLSTAFNEARARINKMDMSPAQKDAAVEKLRTFMRNQHSEEMMKINNLPGRTYNPLAGNFANFPVEAAKSLTPVPDLVKQGLAFATGGALGYGVGANKNAIADMLKSTKLPTAVSNALSGPGLLNAAIGETLFGGKQDLDDYMLPSGDPFNLVEEAHRQQNTLKLPGSDQEFDFDHRQKIQKLMEEAGITSAEVDLDEQVKFLGSLPEGFEDWQLLPHQEDWFQEDETEFDLALDEEPLEQGGIGDLLLWNRLFGS